MCRSLCRSFEKISMMIDDKCWKLCRDHYRECSGQMPNDDFLVESILKDLEKRKDPLSAGALGKEFASVYLSFAYFDTTDITYLHEKFLRLRFKLALRLNTRSFPEKLGDMFYEPGSVQHLYVYQQFYGSDWVKQTREAVLGQVRRAFWEDKVELQNLVTKAASNDQMSIDGVYELIRIDPVSALLLKPQFSKPASKSVKPQSSHSDVKKQQGRKRLKLQKCMNGHDGQEEDCDDRNGDHINSISMDSSISSWA